MINFNSNADFATQSKPEVPPFFKNLSDIELDMVFQANLDNGHVLAEYLVEFPAPPCRATALGWTSYLNKYV